jgi:hypothetical protein
MSYALAYNPTDGPVVIDAAGRTLGGREWGPANTTDDFVKQAVDARRLVLAAIPAKGAAPEPVQAHREAQRLTERQRALQAMEKPQLLELAVAAGLARSVDDPNKADLVSVLSHSSVDLPAAAKPSPKE